MNRYSPPPTSSAGRTPLPGQPVRFPNRGRQECSLLAQVVILTVIPQATIEPHQTALTRNAAQSDLARPNWTVETSRIATYERLEAIT